MASPDPKEKKPARPLGSRLRWVGYGVLLACTVVFVLKFRAPASPVSAEALTALALAGLALLLAAEFGPLIHRIKAGELEVDFKEVDSSIGDLDKRIRDLEVWQASQTSDREPLPTRLADPAALAKKVSAKNDPHKGRFGPIPDGVKLVPSFRSAGADWVKVILTLIVDTSVIDLKPGDHAEFFMHPTFKKHQRMKATFDAWKPGELAEAELSFFSAGGFTVGVWLPGPNLEFELDLAEAPRAPDIIKFL